MAVVGVVVAGGLFAGLWRVTTTAGVAAEPGWDQVAAPRTPSPTSPSVTETASAAASPSPAPSTAAPSVPAVTRTAASTSAAPSPTGVPTALTKNAVYSATFTGQCTPLAAPSSASAARKLMTDYLACMNQVWAGMLRSTSTAFTPASIYFVVNAVDTPCDTYRTDLLATYCPVTQTIYVGPDAVSTAVNDRLYAAELVTHEYAAHVQNLTQILTAAQKRWGAGEEFSRRTQLQARCLAFAVLTHVDGFEPDVARFRAEWKSTPASVYFGTTASVQYWGEKALKATKVGDCDTYSVPSSLVA